MFCDLIIVFQTLFKSFFNGFDRFNEFSSFKGQNAKLAHHFFVVYGSIVLFSEIVVNFGGQINWHHLEIALQFILCCIFSLLFGFVLETTWKFFLDIDFTFLSLPELVQIWITKGASIFVVKILELLFGAKLLHHINVVLLSEACLYVPLRIFEFTNLLGLHHQLSRNVFLESTRYTLTHLSIVDISAFLKKWRKKVVLLLRRHLYFVFLSWKQNGWQIVFREQRPAFHLQIVLLYQFLEGCLYSDLSYRFDNLISASP